MKLRKVSASLLDEERQRAPRAMSPRELRRLEIEGKLEEAIRRADQDVDSAFRIELEEGEKAPTIRLAFGRVKERLGSNSVNLFARGDMLIVAKRPQTRGRKAKAAA